MKDLEAKTGKQFGGAENPLLVSVRSGSSMSMPGMMDTILNLGLNKTTLQGLIKLTEQSALRLRRLPAFHPALRQDCARCRRQAFRRCHGAMKKRGRQAGRRPVPSTSAKLGRAFPAIVECTIPAPFPGRPLQATRNRDQGGVPFLERQARRRLPQAVQASPRTMANGTAVNMVHHGLRQHGQRFRHRRRLHAQPGHRRKRDLRRVPGQRPGRGRGGRHPHAEGHRRNGAGDAGNLPATARIAQPARIALQARCRTSNSPSSVARCTACRPATAR
jgi:hypothetical protein